MKRFAKALFVSLLASTLMCNYVNADESNALKDIFGDFGVSEEQQEEYDEIIQGFSQEDTAEESDGYEGRQKLADHIKDKGKKNEDMLYIDSSDEMSLRRLYYDDDKEQIVFAYAMDGSIIGGSSTLMLLFLPLGDASVCNMISLSSGTDPSMDYAIQSLIHTSEFTGFEGADIYIIDAGSHWGEGKIYETAGLLGYVGFQIFAEALEDTGLSLKDLGFISFE